MSDQLNRYERALATVTQARVTHRLAEREVAKINERLIVAELNSDDARIALNDAETELLDARDAFEEMQEKEAEEKLGGKLALA